MSETKDPRRTRRRASRTAGPPVEDATEQPTADAAADPQAAESRNAASDTPGGTAAEKIAGAAAEKPGKVVAEKSEDDTERIEAAAETPAAAAPGDAGDTVRIDKPAADTVVPGKTATAAESGRTADSSGKTDAGDEETVASTEKSAEAESVAPAGSRSWKRIVALAAAAVLVIGLVGAAVVSMIAVQSTEQRDERRAEYVATARQTVLNLTTIRADTAKEDIDRILTMASGEFKTEFDGRVDPFTEIVKQAKVQSTGEVVEAAVERDDENSAVILIAAKQTLTNAGAEGEQQRFYRFRVTVQRGDDGALTASDVEFVA